MSTTPPRAASRSDRRWAPPSQTSTPPRSGPNLTSFFESPSPTTSPRKTRTSNATSMSMSAAAQIKPGHQRTRSWLASCLRPRTVILTQPPPLLAAEEEAPHSPRFSFRERSGSVSATLKRWRKPRPSVFGGPLVVSDDKVEEPAAATPVSYSYSHSTASSASSIHSSPDPGRKFRSGEALAEWNRELSRADGAWRSSVAEPFEVDTPPLASPQPSPTRRRASYHGEVPIPRPSPAVPRSEAVTLSLVSVWDDFLGETEISFSDEGNSSMRSNEPFPPATGGQTGWSTAGVQPFTNQPSRCADQFASPRLFSSAYAPPLAPPPFPSPPLVASSLFPAPSLLAARRLRPVPALVLSTSPSTLALADSANSSYFSPVSSASSNDGSDHDEGEEDDDDLTTRRPPLQGLAIDPSSFAASPIEHSTSFLQLASSSPIVRQRPRLVSSPFVPSPASMGSSMGSSTFSSPYEHSHSSKETLASSVAETEGARWEVSEWGEIKEEVTKDGATRRRREAVVLAGEVRRGVEDGQVEWGLAV